MESRPSAKENRDNLTLCTVPASGTNIYSTTLSDVFTCMPILTYYSAGNWQKKKKKDIQKNTSSVNMNMVNNNIPVLFFFFKTIKHTNFTTDSRIQIM